MANPLARAVTDMAVGAVFRRAAITGVEDHPAGMRSITLEGPRLRGVRWVPGAKVQVRTEGFTTRTYTPTSWDPVVGRATLLVATHAGGPGSALMVRLVAGDEVQFLGPRASIDLTTVTSAPVIVGDETCFGLALAWHTGIGGRATCCLESLDPGAASELLARLGIEDPVVVATEPSHRALAAAVTASIERDPSAHLIVAGRAQSIRQVRLAVRDSAGHTGKTTVKAYWDENWAGLD